MPAAPCCCAFRRNVAHRRSASFPPPARVRWPTNFVAREPQASSPPSCALRPAAPDGLLRAALHQCRSGPRSSPTSLCRYAPRGSRLRSNSASHCAEAGIRQSGHRPNRDLPIHAQPSRSGRHIRPTTDGTSHKGRSEASRSRPNLQNQIRRRSPSHRPIPRKRRTRATKMGYILPKPVPATMPRHCSTRTSVRSGTAPSPTAHREPMSIRSKVPKPSVHRDKEPSQDSAWEPRPNRSQERSSTDRRHRGLRCPCNSDRYDPRTWR